MILTLRSRLLPSPNLALSRFVTPLRQELVELTRAHPRYAKNYAFDTDATWIKASPCGDACAGLPQVVAVDCEMCISEVRLPPAVVPAVAAGIYDLIPSSRSVLGSNPIFYVFRKRYVSARVLKPPRIRTGNPSWRRYNDLMLV